MKSNPTTPTCGTEVDKTRQAPLADKTINTQTPPADKTANTKHQIERTAPYIEIVRRVKIDPAKDYKAITGVPHRPTPDVTLKIFKTGKLSGESKLTRQKITKL